MSIPSFNHSSPYSNNFATLAQSESNPQFNLLNPDAHAELGWWIEIFTAQPPCLYYFGAFENAQVAQFEQQGFIEDLLGEGAQGLATRIQLCAPLQLTLDQGEIQSHGLSDFPPGVTII
jgi:Domain of unknown function (DUF1816)